MVLNLGSYEDDSYRRCEQYKRKNINIYLFMKDFLRGYEEDISDIKIEIKDKKYVKISIYIIMMIIYPIYIILYIICNIVQKINLYLTKRIKLKLSQEKIELVLTIVGNNLGNEYMEVISTTKHINQYTNKNVRYEKITKLPKLMYKNMDDMLCEKFPKLKYLSYPNKITKEGLKKLKMIEKIRIRNIYEMSKEKIEEIILIVPEMKNLKRIMYKIEITSNGWQG